MSHPTARKPYRRHSGGERVFADDVGRLWSAAHAREDAESVVVFSCISDARQTVRAIAVGDDLRIADVSDEQLRAWLREAPRIGRLT
jgi:hypothetical protein